MRINSQHLHKSLCVSLRWIFYSFAQVEGHIKVKEMADMQMTCFDNLDMFSHSKHGIGGVNVLNCF